MGKMVRFLALFGTVLALSGFVWISNSKPFGEEKLSESQAQAVISQLSAELTEEMPKNYYLSCEEGIYSQPAEFFGGEENVAYLEADNGEYMLLGETLFFANSEGEVFCREVEWEQLFADEIAARAWQKAMELIKDDSAETEFEYIPMAEEHPYHLSAEFTREGEIAYSLSAYMNADGDCDVLIFQMRKNDHDSDLTEDISLSTSFFFGEAEPLQKERRIWHFAKECGLTEEPVPALGEQKTNREYCESVMTKLDFESLAERAEKDESLEFPFDERDFVI